MISRVSLACLPSLLICCIENRNTETKKKAVFLSLLLCLPKNRKEELVMWCFTQSQPEKGTREGYTCL